MLKLRRGSNAFIVQTLHGNEFHVILAAFVAKLTLGLWLRSSSRRSNFGTMLKFQTATKEELKLAAAVQRRRQIEAERKERIFNARFRKIGVSLMGTKCFKS